VLESYYEAPREQVAAALRALVAMPSVAVVDASTLLRALAVYEEQRLHFAEAHLVAQAEATGVGTVLSFDRALRRVESVEWRQP
jgi:predicted nucleic acid-binding protein